MHPPKGPIYPEQNLRANDELRGKRRRKTKICGGKSWGITKEGISMSSGFDGSRHDCFQQRNVGIIGPEQ